MIFLGDADYPPLLAMLDDAPPCLIVSGDAALARQRCVAAVGGRNASANGQRMAETLAADLAAAVVVVSGLARGIDAAAHQGAMRTGRTIAVVAGGIDQPYPPENADLQRRIAETDLLITEAPLGTVPQARHFPRRNRIIAGLSLGVVVVEAALRSGSLITARHRPGSRPGGLRRPRLAARSARPGRQRPDPPGRDAGGNRRRRAGQPAAATNRHPPARTRVRRAGPTRPRTRPSRPENPPEAHEQVLSLLSPEPTMVDDLVRRCHLSPSVTVAVLLELELAGRVETLAGSRVALLPDAID